MLDKIEYPKDDTKMLTTIDNPFSPHDSPEQWRSWDRDKGHFTEEYLARVVTMNIDITKASEFEIELEGFKAMQEIVEHDSEQKYILV